MRRKTQLEFNIEKPGSSFGGHLLRGNPKSYRPLSSKLPVHLMIKSTKATGLRSMRHHSKHIAVNRMVDRIAKRYGVKILRYVNVGNHLHILVQIKKLILWKSFIRALTGRLAQFLQNLKGQQKAEPFWDFRPFTRVVAGWGKAYQTIKEYLYLNHLEAEGHINRREMQTLRDLRAFLSG